MKRAFSIKISFVFLAWLLLFIHNIIPHFHHPADIFTCCKGPAHNAGHEKDPEDITVTLINHHEDLFVCHISGLLYHNNTDDNYIYDYNRKTIAPTVQIHEHPAPIHDPLLIKDHLPEQIDLRAPPLT